MTFVANLLTTADGYTDANTLDAPGTVKVSPLQIANAGVYVQMARPQEGVSQRAANWSPEVFYAPGLYSLIRRIERIRFRSAVAGTPAVVTVECLTATD